jgi:PKD repeat protein
MTKIMRPIISLFLLLISSGITAQNLLNEPESVVYDATHKRYLLSNWADGNIVQIDSNGVHSYFYSELGGNVAGLYINDGLLYAAASNSLNEGLVVFNLDTGEKIKTITFPGMSLLNGIATDTSGYIYVTDYYANVIFKAGLNNDYGSVFVTGGLDRPNGAAFDARHNRLLVSNENAPGNPIIAVSLEDSTYYNLVDFGKGGSDGLVLDQFGNCYLSTWSPGTVWKYDSTFTNPPVEVSIGHNAPADIHYIESDYLLALPCFYGNSLDIISPFISIESDTSYGFPGLTVEFTGSSPLEATSWSWDFGNSETGSGQSASSIFNEVGMYDITLEITAEGHNISFTEDNFIIILADTMAALDAQGDPGGTVEVNIYANNSIPLTYLRIPVEYSGPLGLTFDSISTAGCRTEHFDNKGILSQNTGDKTATFRVYNDISSGTPALEPGNGIVLKIYFTIMPGVPFGFTNSIIIDGYSTQSPRFVGPDLNYEPITESAQVSLSGICGDVNEDEAVNIKDITNLIKYKYKGGPAPQPNECLGDVNNDDVINIKDITYLIKYKYKGGSLPSAYCCNPVW